MPQLTYSHNDKENSVAVFVDETLKQTIIPVEFLPDGIRVGDVVELAILPDYRKLEELQQHIGGLLRSVTTLKPGNPEMKEAAYRNLIFRLLRELARERDGGFWFRSIAHASEVIAAELMGRK